MAATRRNVTEPEMVEVIPSVPLHLLLLEGEGCWCTRNTIRGWNLLRWKCRKIKYLRRVREGGQSMCHQQYFGERFWTKGYPPISLGDYIGPCQCDMQFLRKMMLFVRYVFI